MAGSSILRNLTDADLESLHHLIRRDAMSDLAIARWAEECLNSGAQDGQKPAGEAIALGPTDQARIMVVARYRAGKDYQAWLKRWENQDAELHKAMMLQQQRFDLVTHLVGDADEGGMDRLSKGLQARLLTLAAEATDAELKEASGKSGWIKNVIRVIQQQAQVERSSAGAAIKGEIERQVQTGKLDEGALVKKVDEIMGIKNG